MATATTYPTPSLPKERANSTLKTEKDACSCARSVRLFASTPTPSGSNKDERQRFKEDWMEEWAFIRPYLDDERPVVVCGDLNIAHTEDDIWNKGREKL